MRGHVILFTLIILSFSSLAGGAVWKKSNYGIDNPDIRMIISGRDDTIYAITTKDIYRSRDRGQRWYRLKAPGGIETINTIHLMDEYILLGTNKGLFLRKEGKVRWKHIYRTKDSGPYGILSIDSYSGRIYLGVWDGIVILDKKENKWKERKYYRIESPVYSIAIDKHNHEIVYAVSLNGLYRSTDSGKNWDRIFNLDFNSEYEITLSPDEIEEPILPEKRPQIITSPFIPGMVFVTAPEGIFISRDNGDTWRPLSTTGLPSTRIRDLVVSDEDTLYTTTDRGLFRYSFQNNQWYDESDGISTTDVRTIAITKGQDHRLLIGTARGVFVSRNLLSERELQEIDKRVKEIFSMFSNEPSIEEIREAAIRYAEVHPEKIRKWRRSASRRAWLPTIRFEYQRGHDWESSTYFYSTTTQKYKDDDITKGRDSEWSVSLTWNLGDLIWNSDQTSIDVRSRLMVKLRDEILNEVTHLYYERRRLQIELLLDPPDDLKERIEKELRLQELTADIDALTGSYLSRRLLNPRSSSPHQ